MNAEQSDTCENCRFWLGMDRGDENSQLGACRRYPPSVQPHLLKLNGEGWEHPLVYDSYWCGEHQLKVVAVTPAPPTAVPDIALVDLNWPVTGCMPTRVPRILQQAGLTTYADICRLGLKQLMNLPGFGGISLGQLLEALERSDCDPWALLNTCQGIERVQLADRYRGLRAYLSPKKPLMTKGIA